MKPTTLHRALVRSIFAAAAVLWATTAHAEISITLKNTFIEKYKNRATIDAQFVVDHSKGKANSPSADGDMHASGRDAANIGLATVAEIMNAKDHKDAINATVAAEGTGQPIAISGAWRIWNEHGGDNTFTQGKPLAAAQTTNPDHVFEIHPITKVGSISLLDSFKEIPGYQPKQPDVAFPHYDQIRSKIIPRKTTTTIISAGIGYNYVKFQMVLAEKPIPVEDGALAKAEIRDLEGHMLLRSKRMIFVKDTPPELAVRDNAASTCLRVLGIPRVDLALVAWRVKNRKDERDPLNWNLPYEIIVAGVYNEPCVED